jgi:ADP-heptose:LPS heptosyltransferase
VPAIDVGPVEKRPFIAVHPFSGSPKKNWQHYEELASRLPLPVEWCIGPEQEWHEAHRFESLWDVARWLASARLYIGNDSGITHLAAAVGVPTVAIFRVTDPRVWAPRGRGRVEVLHEPVVADVLSAVTRLI